jgi:DNA polymerase III subunit gamma/tau
VSYQVFARKYRPKTFADVLGQDHVMQTLKNAIEQKRLAHAYLFVGPRGTGKTSTARIFAKALNCPGGPSVDFNPDDPVCIEIAEGRNLDVLEIDGASNNGVDQIRELRENVLFAPASSKYKIYYIDEVHMVTTQAFNALLKTLEEPPPHVIFIFATTEAHKILPTIISRCQRFDLRKIPDRVIAEHLKEISRKEGIQLSDAAAFAIAKGADGGMRDAQSMLDQLVAFCGNKIEVKDVLEIFGITAAETVAEMAHHVLSLNVVQALNAVHEASEGGKDLAILLAEMIQHLRTLLVLQVDPELTLDDKPLEVAELMRQQASLVSTDQLLRVCGCLAEVDTRMKWSSNKQMHLELGMIQAIQLLKEVSISDILDVLTGQVEVEKIVEAKQQHMDKLVDSQVKPLRTLELPQKDIKIEEPKILPVPEVKSAVKEEAVNEVPWQIEEEPVKSQTHLEQEVESPQPTIELTDSLLPKLPPIELNQLNENFKNRASERLGLFSAYLSNCEFTKYDEANGAIVLGFPEGEESNLKAISQKETHKLIEQELKILTGRPLQVKLEIDNKLPKANELDLFAGFLTQESKVVKPKTKSKKTAEEIVASLPLQENALDIAETTGAILGQANMEVQDEKVIGEDFYQDPLIAEAVEKFRLKLISKK